MTAFYGIYDPATATFSATPAPATARRVLRRCSNGCLIVLNQATGMPLGIVPDENHREAGYTPTPVTGSSFTPTA